MTKSNIPFWDSARHPSAQHHSWPATGHQNSDETCKAILLHEGQLIQRKQIRWPSLFFFLRKTTTTATLDKTEKDLLGPLLVRVSDLTNHLFICTTLCRLKNYFLSYYVFHIYRIGELAQMVERPLCMREVSGSIPGFSTWCPYSFVYSLEKACLVKYWQSISFVNFNTWLFQLSFASI